MNLILFKPIRSFISRVKEKKNKIVKLLELLDVIDITVSGNTTYISIDNNIILHTKGNTLVYSKDGVLMTKHRRTHINPDIEININYNNNISELSKESLRKKRLKIQQHTFSLLLSHRLISTSRPIRYNQLLDSDSFAI